MALLELALLLQAFMVEPDETPPLDPKTPARIVTCSLRHATNVDLNKEQTEAELTYEGQYSVKLFLPSAAKAGRLPYRLIDDPAGLFGGGTGAFTRTGDVWPKTVELARQNQVQDKIIHNFIILSSIDPATGTAAGFIARGLDAVKLDPKWIYKGPCRIETGAAAAAMERAPS